MWKTYLLRIRVLALSLLACRQHGCKLNLPDGMYLSVVSFMDLNTFRTLRSLWSPRNQHFYEILP